MSNFADFGRIKVKKELFSVCFGYLITNGTDVFSYDSFVHPAVLNNFWMCLLVMERLKILPDLFVLCNWLALV